MVPTVPETPYDGYVDPVPDYLSAMDVCASDFDTAMAACAGISEPHDLCDCQYQASQARKGCEMDAAISFTPTWLEGLATIAASQKRCCGGNFSADCFDCENAYLGALATGSVEANDLAGLKVFFLAWYDTQMLEQCHPGGSRSPRPPGSAYLDVPDYAETTARQAYAGIRFSHVGGAQRTREKCRVDAEADSMAERGICSVSRHRCTGKATADLHYALSECEFTVGPCLDVECYTALNECRSAAVLVWADAWEACCEAAYPFVDNGHVKAQCRKDETMAWLTTKLQCCNEYSQCVTGCNGSPTDISTCLETCATAKAACDAAAGSSADESACQTAKGDCPDCWPYDCVVLAPTPPTCSISNPVVPICVEPVGGLCENGLPCDEDAPCSVGSECCYGLSVDTDKLIVSCSWFSCVQFLDDRTEADLLEGETLCPEPLPPPPALPGCEVDCSLPG